MRRATMCGYVPTMAAGLAALGILTLGLLNLPVVSRTLDSPSFCASCHAMSPQVESHLRSSHRDVPCGHCHLPRSTLRYPIAKAYSGSKDVLVFLSGATPPAIRLAPGGRRVVQQNCLGCHGAMVPNAAARGGPYCLDCHRRVPHGP
ncbi:MAG: NapC/NirT family cytochrome c [Bacillota bacterium]|nr:NapC/NirT family cytochrome c [Bacillota bacterium]